MKPLIILAALLLSLLMACGPVEQPAMDIPAQPESWNEAAEPIAATEDDPVAVETLRSEPAADGSAVSPLTIRDAYRGGMDSLLRELHYPQGGPVLVALPQTAEEDLHCEPRYGGGGQCGLFYPDPEGEFPTWWAGFSFAEVESAIAFRESIGKGPVTVSCILSEDSNPGYRGAGFSNCEERKNLGFSQEQADAAMATVEAGWKALTPEPTPTLRPRIIRVEVPARQHETWGGDSWGKRLAKLSWSPSPQESHSVHLAEEEQRDFACHRSVSRCRIDHPGGWMVCRGRQETDDRGVLRVDYADCVREPIPEPTPTPTLVPTPTPVRQVWPGPVQVEVPARHWYAYDKGWVVAVTWDVGDEIYTVRLAPEERVQKWHPDQDYIYFSGGWMTCDHKSFVDRGEVTVYYHYDNCVWDAE